jgi:uncharacterized protein (TIGR02996 family)
VAPTDFFSDVYARPSDDAAKQVLADALLEAGDPRGEFIALQMLPRRGRKAELKLERLLERHRAAFLGPLAASVLPAGQVWEKGFLVECRAALDGRLVDEPAWATVRKLEVVNDDAMTPRELSSPHLKSLREVSQVPRAGVLEVFAASRSLPFTSVALEGPGLVTHWDDAQLRALREARSLPDLRHLGLRLWRFHLEELEWLWTAPVFGRARSVELALHRVAINLGALRDRLIALSRDVPDALVLKGRQLELKLKPAEAWAVMHLTVKTPLVEAVIVDAELMLQSLPADGLARLDVTCDFLVHHDALARLKRLTRRFPRLAPVTWPRGAGG